MPNLLNKLLITSILLLAMLGSIGGRVALASSTVDQGGGDSQSQGLQNNPNCQDSSENGIHTCLQTNPIVKELNVIVNFLSAGVGLVVIGSIIIGSIQYIMAGDSADAVSKAKQRITSALMAFVLFLLIFSFLQWIIPGGLFSK
jgi:hypothetical protein